MGQRPVDHRTFDRVGENGEYVEYESSCDFSPGEWIAIGVFCAVELIASGENSLLLDRIVLICTGEPVLGAPPDTPVDVIGVDGNDGSSSPPPQRCAVGLPPGYVRIDIARGSS